MDNFKKKYSSIRKNREFQYLFKKGECIVTYQFVCYYLPSRRRQNRCGIVTSKKIGNAVKRNRARRVIRESFRQIEPMLRAGTDKRYDFIFVARGKTPETKSTKILDIMQKKLVPKLI